MELFKVIAVITVQIIIIIQNTYLNEIYIYSEHIYILRTYSSVHHICSLK